jgi:hypothetical protein
MSAIDTFTNSARIRPMLGRTQFLLVPTDDPTFYHNPWRHTWRGHHLTLIVSLAVAPGAHGDPLP